MRVANRSSSDLIVCASAGSLPLPDDSHSTLEFQIKAQKWIQQIRDELESASSRPKGPPIAKCGPEPSPSNSPKTT